MAFPESRTNSIWVFNCSPLTGTSVPLTASACACGVQLALDHHFLDLSTHGFQLQQSCKELPCSSLSPTGSGSLVELDSHREQVRLSTQIRTRSHDVIKSTNKIVLDFLPASPPPLPEGCDTFLSKPRLTWALIFNKGISRRLQQKTQRLCHLQSL